MQRDNWIDQAIADAQQRGDFDDLPGQGKPLRLEGNPLAPEWDTAFSVLKNAGVAPYWIELGKEIRADLAALDDLRQRAAQDFATRLDLAHAQSHGQQQATPAPGASQKRGFARLWWLFRRQGTGGRPVVGPRVPGLTDLEARRQRTRQEYLERAAKLDEKITAYNAAIPKDLWERERPRLPAHRAAQDFDDACPPIPREP